MFIPRFPDSKFHALLFLWKFKILFVVVFWISVSLLHAISNVPVGSPSLSIVLYVCLCAHTHTHTHTHTRTCMCTYIFFTCNLGENLIHFRLVIITYTAFEYPGHKNHWTMWITSIKLLFKYFYSLCIYHLQLCPKLSHEEL